jgi:phosphocarrier protein FPr/phosphocarrier protein
VITTVATASHALTLRTGTGVDLLLHVGIDTVGLNGASFTRKVEQGATVRRGDPLLEIDLDRLARGAKSLITPVVVTDAARFPVELARAAGLIRAGEPFLEIGHAELSKPAEAGPTALPDATVAVTVRLPHGFHARPAARIARISRQYASRVVLSAHGRHADAGSSVALMGLCVGAGDRVELRAFGTDAGDAVHALTEAIESRLGEPAVSTPALASSARCCRTEADPGCAPTAGEVAGTVASRGLAIGIVLQLEEVQPEVPEAGAGVDFEHAELEKARNSVRRRLLQLAARGADESADILSAQCEFLDDPALLDHARNAIADGKSAGHAWRSAIREAEQLLRGTGDSRLVERVADLADIEAQVLQALTDPTEVAAPRLPDSAVILAGELLPSRLARLDLSKVAGFCSASGGPTSHVALLAASLGIPAMVGAGPSILGIPNGTPVFLDAEAGRLVVEPDEDQVAKARGDIAARRQQRSGWLELAAKDCRTIDGRRVRIFANLVASADAVNAVESGAEGCGLLRTEFLFQNRRAAPSEDEQAAEYQAIADALAPRPLVIRLLDAGGDKSLPYLRLPREENPLLGLRGLRALFGSPELLRDQLAAILRVESAGGCRILLPMVTEAGDVRRVRAIVDELAGGRAQVAVGAMVETPSSVALAHSIARAADFLSIGTNDLAQYTLAMDRTHPVLAGTFDHFHPAVLHQIAAVCEAAEAAGCDVSVCGALASDVCAAPVLIGLGVHTLSAVPGVIPELKAAVRSLSFGTCRELAREALAQEDAASLRRCVEVFAAARDTE